MMTFTHDELADLIARAGVRSEETPNTITSREFAAAKGVGIDKARRMIREAIEAGLLVAVRAVRLDMTGTRQEVWAYQATSKE